MALLRVQVVFERQNGLPADRVVNVFHFGTADEPGEPAFDAQVTEIEDLLGGFYLGLHGAGNKPLCGWMSGALQNQAEMRFYNMADAAPRLPFHIAAFGPAMGLTALPGEVALCVSWHGQMQSGVNRQRLRGRNYIGPLAEEAAVLLPQSSGQVLPNGNFIAHLAAAGRFLLTGGDDPSGFVQLVVYSAGARNNANKAVPYDQRPLLPPLVTPVVRCYVDNAFDTQRRRGMRETVRTFSAP
jgi:hypothetical protein